MSTQKDHGEGGQETKQDIGRDSLFPKVSRPALLRTERVQKRASFFADDDQDPPLQFVPFFIA